MSCPEATTAMIDGFPIDSSKTEVLLGITIDHELKFDDHVNHLCKKGSLKLCLCHVNVIMNFAEIIWHRIYIILSPKNMGGCT